DDIEQLLKEKGHEIALILLGGVNYYSGQVYDMKQITQWGHEAGCVVGFDLAHGVGNIPLELHDWGVDFAVWCTYKYLNSGPGSLGGCFVHEKHAKSFELPRFSAWWGHNKEERFLMKPDFIPIEGAEGWQLSNPPILSLAAIRASLDIFHEIGIDKLRKKSIKLTRFLRFLIETLLSDQISIITPSEIKHQGCQLSLVLEKNAKQVYNTLVENSVFADWREPNVIRIAPVPLYNSFADVFRFVEVMKNSTVG
ncbi:MAG: kynureninase, partial [Candidatus Heimdallarchaeota archaeon]|nr:kynureninase [Candidatus Heimdallarchaeota archaeon]